MANFAGYPSIYGVPIQSNYNGDPCDAFFNIFLDPQFIDTNRFLLSNFSPCIDAGDPAIADVCPQFSHGSAISDIGAYGGPDACGWLTHGFTPVITSQPSYQSSCVGGSATFKVRVEGSEPLSYRWYFNGTTPLAGETNAQLNLLNLESSQAGLYSVKVSNTFGTITSAPAQLLVSDACVGIHLYAGLSITGMVGRTYNVEYVTNLAATNWTFVASNTFSQPQWLFIDTNTPFDAKKYFRVRLQP
ncbi:MAG: immunoglobulin domain-containing protein [Verrucomicrobia bacterium]|nr:immunoglobulin domain-containing protein [Verrucomicrobiota bacterium]